MAQGEKNNMVAQADGLACRRSGRLIFEAVQFALPMGGALALEGANGSGKTSLLRVLAALLPHAAGRLKTPPPTQIHYIGHAPAHKARLSVRENIHFWRGLLGAPQHAASDETLGNTFDETLHAVGLAAQADLPAGVLSDGQARRLALARLLIAPRPLWLLDEPFSALDKTARTWLADCAAAHLAQGGAIIAATHDALPFTTQTLNLSAQETP